MADIDEEDLNSDAPAENTKKSAGKGNLLVILVGLLVIVIAPLASWLVVRLTLPQNDVKIPEQQETALQSGGIVLPIDSLVVNVAGTRMTRILRFTPHLVVSDQRLHDHLKEHIPMIKDRILAISSRRTLDDLESLEARDSLKRDIMYEINNMARGRMAGSVLDVAFSEFLIQ